MPSPGAATGVQIIRDEAGAELLSVYDSVVVMAPYNNGPLHVESDAEAILALSQYPAGQSDQISNAAS